MRSIRWTACFLAVIASGACGSDPSGVAAPFGLEVTVASLVPDSSEFVSGGARRISYFCDIALSATGIARSDQVAEWHSGVMHVVASSGVVRGIVVPPGRWDRDALVGLWGGSSFIRPNEELISDTLRVSPSEYLFVFRFTDLASGEIFATDGTPATCPQGPRPS